MGILEDLVLPQGASKMDLVGLDEAESPSILQMNPADYLDDLSDLDVADGKKLELLGILWSIMQSMAALHFAHDVCGQIFGSDEEFPSIPNGGVESPIPARTEKHTDQDEE